MPRFVEISFDCLPLRSIGRVDVPMDASPVFRAKCERILRAMLAHGSHNSYYLHNARCVFHLTNEPEFGMLEFTFEGTALTEETDQRTARCDLTVELARETCDWLTEPVVAWFANTVPHAVRVEFDHYIAAGDLAKAVERMKRIDREAERQGGYLGMYL